MRKIKSVAIAIVGLLAIAAVLIAALGIVSGFLRHERQTIGAGGALVHVTYETARDPFRDTRWL